MHVERGEVVADVWSAAVALERRAGGEYLALGVVVPGEPGARQRSRILAALGDEARNLGFTPSA